MKTGSARRFKKVKALKMLMDKGIILDFTQFEGDNIEIKDGKLKVYWKDNQESRMSDFLKVTGEMIKEQPEPPEIRVGAKDL